MDATIDRARTRPRDAVGAPPRISAGHQFPALDGMRAVAALLVLVTHVSFVSGHDDDQIGALLSRFDCGVAIFFVLSGFLLYRPFALAHFGARSDPNVGRYA